MKLNTATQKIFHLALILASTCKVSAAADMNAWHQLDLGSTQIAGSAVYYEKCFEPKLPIFEKAYRQFLVESQKSKAVLSKKEQIIADINRILGISEPDSKMQNEMLEYYLGLFAEAKLTFCVAKKATIKDFLRAGGQLPNFAYNEASDTATYWLEFRATSRSRPVKDLEVPFPLNSQTTFEQEVNETFRMLQDQMYGSSNIGAAVHEVTEMSLLGRARPKDPYWRWFSDGLANAITIELLKRYAGREDAEEFAAGHDANKYKELEKETNLRYWLTASLCIEAPLEYERKLTHERYAYATFEAQRLIEKHGIDCVRKILDEVCARKSGTSEALLEAVEQITGEDMKERLGRYQTFSTREEGIRKYSVAFNAAAKKQDYQQMLINLLRVMELHEFQYSPDSLQTRMNASWLLFMMGYEQAGDEAMQDCMRLFEQGPVPHGRQAAMEMFVIYALKCEKPQKALKVAEELLKTKPDALLPLTVQMLVDAQTGKLNEAKQIAKKIHSLTKSEQSFSYKEASKVLAIDPNEAD